MKKKQCIFFALILIIVVGAVVIILNIPDNQQTSFVVDGNNWSGEVVSDYHNIAGTISEFHIIALNDGKGEMVFQCTNDDGRTDKYILELSISRHQKKYLQIDSISFKKRE